MKSMLIVLLGFLSLTLSAGSFAGCGDAGGCGGDSGCQMSVSGIGYSCSGPGPGTSCNCVDVACREDNPCLSPSKCCQAFGNIAGIDGFPND